jgi:hypothetical protein
VREHVGRSSMATDIPKKEQCSKWSVLIRISLLLLLINTASHGSSITYDTNIEINKDTIIQVDVVSQITGDQDSKMIIDGRVEIIPPLVNPQLFISPECNIGDITGISDRTNGLVYISTRTGSTYAMVITKLNTLGSPGIVYERYARGNIATKFSRWYANYYFTITPFSIQGNSSDGYYISDSDYRNEGSSTSSYNGQSGLALARGFAYALYSFGCVDASMSDYDPTNWKRWDDVKDKFIYAYPSEFGIDANSYYSYCLYPNVPTTFPPAISYCSIFSKPLVLVSGDTYKEDGGSGSNTNARYTRYEVYKEGDDPEADDPSYYWIRVDDAT